MHEGGRNIIITNARLLGKGGWYRIIVTESRITDIIKEGKVKAVREGWRILDADGCTLIPGIVDAHCHPLAYIKNAANYDYRQYEISSIGKLLGQIIHWGCEVPAGEWIRVVNYSEQAISERRLPYRSELDQVSQFHPVMIIQDTGQKSVLNSCAMDLCGLSRDGDDSGYIYGHEEKKIAKIPPVGPDQLEKGVRNLNQLLLRNGITSVHDTSWTNGYDQWCVWHQIRATELLKSRIHFLVGIDQVEDMQQRGLVSGAGDEYLNIGAAKIALDESLGINQIKEADLLAAIDRAVSNGFWVSLHGSDEQLLDMSLKALSQYQQESLKGSDLVRLEHCPIASDQQLQQIAQAGYQVVAQPGFSRQQDILHSPLYRFASFLGFGGRLAFGSDAPLGEIDVMGDIVHLVENRVDESQRISLKQALDGYTKQGAVAAGEQADKGEIAVGKLADLVLLDRDIEAAEAGHTLFGLQVTHTIVGGEVVWSSIC